MLDGLTLLPVSYVADGMQLVRANVPDVPGLAELVDCFDVTIAFWTASCAHSPITILVPADNMERA